MKLTKSGEIEACCEMARKIIEDAPLETSIQGSTIIWYLNDMWCPIEYCPSCGSKTEIEGEEK